MAAGFFVLVPLLATFLVIRLVFGYVDGIFRGDTGLLTRWIEGTPLDFPGVGVALTLGLLYIIGLLVAAEAGRRAVGWQNAVLSRIPVVKSIYGVAKQATDSLVSPSGHQFSRVVFTEWPREGFLALGFITGRCPSPRDDGLNMLVVYIPTVPNPTSGNLAFVSENKVIETKLTVEEAMKIVFSGGMVLPEDMAVKHLPGQPNLPGP
ncbi:MAG: hypothetical protein BZY79_03810 [SAR202 cluster bacterium Casp-Chloro-G4]|nr:MAG: hypothetical protein BZY79_03810 [SAR202 cluster bacterium Casp-Chloro-G4]